MRRRLLRVGVGLAIVVLALLDVQGLVQTLRAEARLRGRVIRATHDATSAVLPRLAAMMSAGGASSYAEAAREAIRSSLASEFEVFSADGRALFAAPAQAPVRHWPGRADLDAIQAGQLMTLGPISGQAPRLLSYVSLPSGGSTVVVRLATPAPDLAEDLKERRELLVGHALSLLILVVAGGLALFPGTSPGPSRGALDAYEEAMRRLRERGLALDKQHEEERQRLTHHLEDREAMARAGELTAAIAHEVRNGLGTIVGYARLLDRSGSEAEVAEASQRIREECETLESVVRRFMDFVKRETLAPASFDLERMLSRVVARESRSRPGAGVSIGGDLGSVVGDEELLERAFENLVRNALDAACSGGHVSVEGRRDGLRPVRADSRRRARDEPRGPREPPALLHDEAGRPRPRASHRLQGRGFARGRDTPQPRRAEGPGRDGVPPLRAEGRSSRISVSDARRRNQVTKRVTAPAGLREQESEPAAPGPWWRRGPVVAAAVGLLAYLPSLGGGFLYDDGVVVVQNPSIRSLRALGTVLRYDPARPLLNLTWAINYALGGLTPWPFHLGNVLIHAINAALVASLFAWMARRSRRVDSRAALLGACLFAATPMAAETVAYVSSRSTALAALFVLLSLRLAAVSLETGSRACLAASLSAFLLALGSKEEAAALPLLLLLLDYFFVAEQRFSDMRRRLWLHGPYLVLVPLGLVARRVATGEWLPAGAIPRGLYLLTQCSAFPLYLGRALVPFDPSFYRYQTPAPWPPDAFTLAAVALTLTVAVLALRFRREWPEWSFAVLFLAAGLLPSSSVVALQEMVVDHRAYLGSVGVAFALGGVLWRLGGLRLGIVAVAVLGAWSIHYEWILADPVRAWEDAVREAPTSPDALCALGESYAARRDPRAEAAFLEATRLNPANYRYWANLGVFYSEREELEKAVSAMQRAVLQAPHDPVVREFLGQLLLRLGRDQEAARELEAVIAAQPGLALARIDLAAVALRQGQPERARALLDSASRLPTEA